jgi:hypothetical protein
MITMYGASDDLVEIEGKNPGCDEIGCFDSDVVVTVGDEASGGVRVVWHYSGEWSAEIAPLAEGVRIPWPIRVRSADASKRESDYSAVVEIDCPETVAVSHETRSADLRKRADQATDLRLRCKSLADELEVTTRDRDKKAAALAEIAKASAR